MSALDPHVITNLRALLNEIDGARIKDGTITASKLAPGSVTNDAVAPGELTGDRLAANTVTNSQLAPNVTAGVRGWQLVQDRNPSTGEQATSFLGGTARCPAGTQVLGGGIKPDTQSITPALAQPEFMIDSGPELNVDGSSGWTAAEVWGDGVKQPWSVTVWAVCGQAVGYGG